MTAFKVAHTAADDWASAAKTCADALSGTAKGANLGFLYVTDGLADDCASILTYLRQTTGIEHWVGSVGMGICANGTEYFDQPAVAVMAATLPEDSFAVFPAISEGMGQLPGDCQAWIKRVAPSFGIVHADPANPRCTALIEELSEKTSGFFVGGLTSSRGTSSQIAGTVTGGGVSGVLFAPDVEVATGLTQGCTPIGESHLVSDCLDNVLIGLDGRRALDVFKEDIGELLARNLSRVTGYIHAGIPITGADTGDYMVRDITGIDPERGWIAIGGEPAAGGRVMFVRRDPQSAEEDLRAMLARLSRRLPGRPRGGVYFSCVARGPYMFGEAGKEMRIIRDMLGDVPLVGFYGAGEVSNCRLYGYTGVIALFL